MTLQLFVIGNEIDVLSLKGRTGPISQTMIIANSGGGTLNWSLSKSAAWLTLSSDNGTANGSVTLSENLTGLSAGVYSDNITVTAAGASNSPLIMTVTLTVTSGGDSTFVYDGNGQRIRKTENGQTILYINRYFEKNLKTGEVTTYYYMGGRLVSMRKGARLMYIHQDHLTGTSLMSDSTGAQVGTTMKYYPFGGLRSGSVPTDIKFTGQRLDDSGLYYYNARYYDPQIGRFISADSIVSSPLSSQSFNRYSYAQNNPLCHIDSSGHGWGLAVLAALIVVEGSLVGMVVYGCSNAVQGNATTAGGYVDAAIEGASIAAGAEVIAAVSAVTDSPVAGFGAGWVVTSNGATLGHQAQAAIDHTAVKHSTPRDAITKESLTGLFDFIVGKTSWSESVKTWVKVWGDNIINNLPMGHDAEMDTSGHFGVSGEWVSEPSASIVESCIDPGDPAIAPLGTPSTMGAGVAYGSGEFAGMICLTNWPGWVTYVPGDYGGLINSFPNISNGVWGQCN